MSEVKGSWSGVKAGGCFNHGSWRFNSQYTLSLSKAAKVTLELHQTSTDFSAGLYVASTSGLATKKVLIEPNVVSKSGFKGKKVVIHEAELAAGDYVVIPCAFEAGKEGEFVLKASAGKLKRMRSSKDWKTSSLKGKWDGATAGGCKNHKTFKHNPQFPFAVTEKSQAVFLVYQTEKDEFDNMGWYVVKSETLGTVDKVLSTNIVGKCPFESDSEAIAPLELEAGNYVLIPSTFEPDNLVNFNITVFSDTGIKFVGDTSVGSDDKDDDDTPAASSSKASIATPASSASSDVDLIKEKQAHLATITKLSDVTGQLEQIRSSNLRLQEQVKSLQSGSGSGTGTAVVDTKLFGDYLAEAQRHASAKDQDKLAEVFKKMQAVIVPEAGASGASSGAAGSVDGTFKETTTPQTGKNVAIFGAWNGKSAGGCLNYPTWRNNPQIFLTIRQPSKLSISLTQQDSDGSKPVSAGMYIFGGDVSNGRRVMVLPDADEDVLAKCKFTDNKTVKMEVAIPASDKPYILMPATFEPGKERGWTVAITSDVEITAKPSSKDEEWQSTVIDGEWTKETAGGCKNHASFTTNPQYSIAVDKKTTINLLLLQSEQSDFDAISMYVVKLPAEKNSKLQRVSNDDIVEKGKFGDGNENAMSVSLNPGRYAIIPCTFEPGNVSKFQLHIFSANGFSADELGEAAEVHVKGEWSNAAGTAGGCLNDFTLWRRNIQYALHVTKDINAVLRLRQAPNSAGAFSSIGFYLFKGGEKRKLRVAEKDILNKTSFVKGREVNLELKLTLGAGPYTIVPCTFNPGDEAEFRLSVFSKDDDPSFAESCKLEQMPVSYTELEASGAWDDTHAGGCLNHATWVINPQFVLRVQKKSEITIFLNTPPAETLGTSIGFYVTKTPAESSLVFDMKSKDIVKKAAFKKGAENAVRFVAEAGSYNIIPATFKPGYKSKFSLTVYSDNLEPEGVTLSRLEGTDISVQGKWEEHSAGGSTSNYESWLKNPRYYLLVKKPMKLGGVLVQSPGKSFGDDETHAPIGFFVVKGDSDGNPKTAKPTDLIARGGYEPEKDVAAVWEIEPSVDPYVIVPSTFDAGVKLTYQFSLLIDPAVREYVELATSPPGISREEYEQQFKAEALLAKLQKTINVIGVNVADLVNLVEQAGLSALDGPVGDLHVDVQRLQKVLLVLKTAQLTGDEDIKLPADFHTPIKRPTPSVQVNPDGSTAPPPPPKSSGPPPPPKPKEEPVKGAAYESSTNMDDLTAILKLGRAQLKNAADRKLKEKPPEKDAFCAFNMEKIFARRQAMEGEDEDEEDDDDWD